MARAHAAAADDAAESSAHTTSAREPVGAAIGAGEGGSEGGERGGGEGDAKVGVPASEGKGVPGARAARPGVSAGVVGVRVWRCSAAGAR